jgi:hypothetical protein
MDEVTPGFFEKLKKSKGYDLFRMMQYEGSALGINMSIPYGSWMGPITEDSYSAPHDLVLEVQNFITEHENLYSTKTFSETAFAFSIQSSYDFIEECGEKAKYPFWKAVDQLVTEKQPFDVIIFPEGQLRADSITIEHLEQYRTLVLPHCSYLTTQQADVILAFLNRGGRVVAVGEPGKNLPGDLRRKITTHPLLLQVNDLHAADLANGPQVVLGKTPDGSEPDMAINLQRVDDGCAVHIIRYDYDEERDEVPILPELELDIRIDGDYRVAKVFSPTGQVELAHHRKSDVYHLRLRNVHVYCVVLLQK